MRPNPIIKSSNNIAVITAVIIMVLVDVGSRVFAKNAGIGVCNSGVSFGWLSSMPAGAALVLEMVWVVLIAWIAGQRMIPGPWYLYVGLYLLVAGGIGHILSRIAWGCVWDWIDLGAINMKGDLADGYIDVGIIAVVVGTCVSYIRETSRNVVSPRKKSSRRGEKS